MTADRELRVLLVEDEALNRALVRAILARQMPGGDVVLREVETIGEARRVLDTERIDVVLLDVRLPDGNGLELAAELRASRAGGQSGTGAPRIAILSASVLREERLAAETSGADAFLGKPFVPHELIDLLTRFETEVGDARNGR